MSFFIDEEEVEFEIHADPAKDGKLNAKEVTGKCSIS